MAFRIFARKTLNETHKAMAMQHLPFRTPGRFLDTLGDPSTECAGTERKTRSCFRLGQIADDSWPAKRKQNRTDDDGGYDG